jgi:hypothetical protein
MNTRNHSQKWTSENLDYLKIAYLKGVPLKKMAAKLHRSVSAINKILTRHNFRTTNRVDYPPFIMRKSKSKGVVKKLLEKQGAIRKTDSQIMGSLPPDDRFWTPFTDVIRWLRQNNIPIIKSSTDTYYEVRGIPKSRKQVLYMANVMREEQFLPVFWVKNITME